jgi:hypothetical protein
VPAKSYEFHGVRILECAPEGLPLRSDRDAVELIGTAWENRASLIVIPASRLADDFFRLKTRIAGEILQKFAIYKMRVAIVGDLSRQVSESSALRDFVLECNRGSQIWFVARLEELEQRLERSCAGRADNSG